MASTDQQPAAPKASEMRPNWVTWVLGIFGSLLVAGATGLNAALSGLGDDIAGLKEKDIAELRQEVAVLKNSFDKASESQIAISEIKWSIQEEKNKSISIEIDRIKHNIDMLAAKLEDMSSSRRR